MLLNASTGVVNDLTDPGTGTFVVKTLATHSMVSVSMVIAYVSTMPPGGWVHVNEIRLLTTVGVTDGGDGDEAASKIVFYNVLILHKSVLNIGCANNFFCS
jgi:hypothetical protein